MSDSSKLKSLGVEALEEKDYFLKSSEFKVWLKEEKGKYFDELSSEKAHSYFRKFIKAWNRGHLDCTSKVTLNSLTSYLTTQTAKYYAGVDASESSAAQTSYKWSFASNTSRADKNALESARESVVAATYSKPSEGSSRNRGSEGRSRVMGPSMPGSSDLQLLREEQAEAQALDRSRSRKRERVEDKDRIEDVVGPKEVGREGQLEKKRVKREGDRAFREKSPGAGLEGSEDFLMGGDSFKARIAQRDTARRKFAEKKQAGTEDKAAASNERLQAMRDKEKKTMEMFSQLAKERFG